jgi:hypothetical protein
MRADYSERPSGVQLLRAWNVPRQLGAQHRDRACDVKGAAEGPQ